MVELEFYFLGVVTSLSKTVERKSKLNEVFHNIKLTGNHLYIKKTLFFSDVLLYF